LHWVRLANEPRVTFAAAVDSKTGDSAWAGLETGTKDPIKNNGTKIHAALRVKAYFNRLIILICPPQIIVMTG
jgi:hypothetical protein